MMPFKKFKHLFRFIFFYLCFQTAFAGPPFITEDPYAAKCKELQLYLFANAFNVTHYLYLLLPALELDYGFAENIEFHIVPSVASYFPQQGINAYGLGDTEVGFKYTFITETDTSPAVAIQPLIELPSGDFHHGLGFGRFWYKFPIWIGKHVGKWTIYGGGGYVQIATPLYKNYWFTGWVVNRDVTDKLGLGVEIFSQGRFASPLVPDSAPVTLVNIGGNYNFNKDFSLVFSAGHNIAGMKLWVGYLGLFWSIK